MDAAAKRELMLTAAKVRKGIIEGVFNAKSGHPGGSLSIADVLTYLYFKEMNIDPVSYTHLYATATTGVFPVSVNGAFQFLFSIVKNAVNL